MNLFKKTFIFFTLLYVLFFVKTWGSVTGNVYSHDDVVYYAQTASLINDGDFDITNNLGPYKGIPLPLSPSTGKIMSYEPVGPSLFFALPYIVTKPVVKMISRVRGTPFNAYDPLFFVTLCFFIVVLFYWSGSLLRKTLSMFFEPAIADISTLFVLWGTILPVYVFRRPVFAVIPEFFWSIVLAYFLAKMLRAQKLTFTQTVLLGLITAGLLTTRWNDVYMVPFCALCIQQQIPRGKGKILLLLAHWSALILTISIVFGLLQATVWKSIYGNIGNFLSFYTHMHLAYITPVNQGTAHQPYFTAIKNFLHILFGIDWGVLFTMPILLCGGITFVCASPFKLAYRKTIHWLLLALIFFAPFFVVLQWKNTGEFYGYRFLISLLPFAALGFSRLIATSWKRYSKLISRIIIGFCLFNFFVILPFELTDNTTLVPTNITPMGGHGWGNNSYVRNAVSFYFHSDKKIVLSAFARGYLGAVIFGSLSLCGVNIEKFSSKATVYFTIRDYKQQIAFLYIFLTGLFLLITMRKNDNPS